VPFGTVPCKMSALHWLCRSCFLTIGLAMAYHTMLLFISIGGFLKNFLDKVQYFIRDEIVVDGSSVAIFGRKALNKKLGNLIANETEELPLHFAMVPDHIQ
jgi:hypothetical protein